MGRRRRGFPSRRSDRRLHGKTVLFLLEFEFEFRSAEQMKSLRSSKPTAGSTIARTTNYDDYQSYVEDQTQYNKEVRLSLSSSSFFDLRSRSTPLTHRPWTRFITRQATVSADPNSSPCNRAHRKVNRSKRISSSSTRSLIVRSHRRRFRSSSLRFERATTTRDVAEFGIADRKGRNCRWTWRSGARRRSADGPADPTPTASVQQ